MGNLFGFPRVSFTSNYLQDECQLGNADFMRFFAYTVKALPNARSLAAE